MAKKQNKNKQQKTTALVVYQNPPPRPKAAKKKQPKKKNAKTLSRGSDDLACYRAALSNPFSVDANGARVPDMFSVPTSTRRITRSFTLAANGAGNADVVVLPSAYIHAFATQGTLPTEPTTFVTGSGTSYPCCTTAAVYLSAQLANYRIVGYGVKIIGIQNDSTAAGKVYVATVPVSTWLNTTAPVGGQTDSHTDAGQTMGNWLTDMGIPNSSNAVAIGTLPSLSNSVLTSVQRVNETPLQVIPKISSPEGMNFRQSSDSYVGFNSQDQTSTSWVTSGDASYLRVGGHEAVVIGVGGATFGTNILEIEIVYHLEGTAAVVSNASYPIAQANDRVVVNPVGWMNVVQQVAKLPSFRLAVEGVGNSIIPGLGTLANRLY